MKPSETLVGKNLCGDEEDTAFALATRRHQQLFDLLPPIREGEAAGDGRLVEQRLLEMKNFRQYNHKVSNHTNHP